MMSKGFSGAIFGNQNTKVNYMIRQGSATVVSQSDVGNYIQDGWSVCNNFGLFMYLYNQCPDKLAAYDSQGET